jgi:histidinol-phosphate/aromatic aminotransferase/cobyric acid decarboxylase-like protein
MNYQQFRALRDRLVAESDLLRLDGMNPAKALASLVPAPPEGPASSAEALRAWLDLFAPDIAPERASVGKGVRELLAVVFAHLAAAGYELWLPEDVYPEYGNLAGQAGLRCHGLVTLPEPRLGAIRAGECAALLLPQPLAPLGRSLTGAEGEFLRAWLGGSLRRRLILDTVYHFASKMGALTRSLWETGQTFVLHSIAKGWLLPDTLGVVLSPPDVSLPCPEVAAAAAGQATAALRTSPEMPTAVEATFRRQWASLTERIRALVPGWRPPSTGYFSVLPVAFEELLRQGILGVPASVFGSRRADLSVISCLYSPA